MNKKLFIILFYLFGILAYSLFAQTQVKCLLPDNYKNKTLSAHTYQDLITYTDTLLATSNIKNSTASFTFNFTHTRLIYFPYGKYKVKFFARPNKNYTLIFPTYQSQTIADSINPYFEPVEIWAGFDSLTHDTLNLAIISFLQEYNDYISKYFYTLYRQGYNSRVDTFLTYLKKKYSSIKIPFFQKFITYKLAEIEFVTKKRDIRKITWDYYRHQMPQYYNPAYMNLFNQMYKYFFNLYALTPKGKDSYYAITRGKSPYLIKQSLSKRYELAGDDTLMEMVMLKGLYDGAFSSTVGAFEKLPLPQLFITLDSIKLLTNIPEHKTIAINIKRKIKETFFSFKDTFKLLKYYTQTQDTFVYENFKGKFAYIGLCDIKNLTCLEHLAINNRFAEHYQNIMDSYLIFPLKQKKEVIKYFRKNKLSYIHLLFFIKTTDIEKLKIAAIPRYVLINPYGKIINEDAPSPTENFNSYFISILRKMK